MSRRALLLPLLLAMVFVRSSSARTTEYYYNAVTQESTWEMPVHYGYSVAFVDKETGRRFWQHQETGETTWHSPGDWEEVYVENTPDTPYYVHRTTKETTWTKPEYLAWTRVEHEYEDPVVEDEDESGERGETKEGGSAGKKKGGWFSK